MTRFSRPIAWGPGGGTYTEDDALTPHQGAVLRVARFLRGFTDTELVAFYHGMRKLDPSLPRQTDSGIRTRRKELMQAGKLALSPITGTTPSGGRCNRWEVV